MMGRTVSRMRRGQGGWEEMLCFVATSKCRAGIGELLKRVVPCMKSPSLFFVAYGQRVLKLVFAHQLKKLDRSDIPE